MLLFELYWRKPFGISIHRERLNGSFVARSPAAGCGRLLPQVMGTFWGLAGKIQLKRVLNGESGGSVVSIETIS